MRSLRFLVGNGLLVDRQNTSLVSYIGKDDSVILPEFLTSIGDGAFGGCKFLQSISLPAALTHIGVWAFSDCTSLQFIYFPAAFTSIGDGAFRNCASLQSVELLASLTSIGDDAFGECSSLEKIIVPKNSVERFKKMLPADLGENLYYLGKAEEGMVAVEAAD